MRVLCTCLPGYGHFNPLVPLARALVRAGHQVAFATSGDFCPRVVRAGFEAFPAGMSMRDQIEQAGRRYPEAKLPPGQERFETFVPRMLAGVAAPARAGDLIPLARRWRPDVILHDEAELAAPLAAADIGVPHASHSIVLRRPPAMTEVAGDTLLALCERWKVDVGPLGGLYRYLHFDACPPSLQAPDLPPVATVRALDNTHDLDTAAGEALPGWINDLPPRPTVYVTLGTVHHRNESVLRSIFDGLGQAPVNVIATIGYDRDPANFASKPDNIVVEHYIPLSLLLPHLDAMVTQGGTSILPALGRGLPLLVVPQAADQFHNGEACSRAGVGVCLLPAEVTAEAVRRALAQLLGEPVFTEQARMVAEEIRAMPGPCEGARLLATLADTGHS